MCDLFYRAGSIHRAQFNKLMMQFVSIIDLKGSCSTSLSLQTSQSTHVFLMNTMAREENRMRGYIKSKWYCTVLNTHQNLHSRTKPQPLFWLEQIMEFVYIFAFSNRSIFYGLGAEEFCQMPGLILQLSVALQGSVEGLHSS